jgi:tRNA uridine 5-carbamoylmethylation protein Kti12
MNKKLKKSEMIDLFIAMRETEADREDLYEMKCLLEFGELPHRKTKKKKQAINFDATNDDVIKSLERKLVLRDSEIEQLRSELNRCNAVHVDLLQKYIRFEQSLIELGRKVDKIKDGHEDPQKCARRISKEIDDLQKRVKETTGDINLDEEIRRLNELSIRRRSFMIKNYVKEEE